MNTSTHHHMQGMSMSTHQHMPGSASHPHHHHTTPMHHSGHDESHIGSHPTFFDTAYEGLRVLFQPFVLKNEKGLAAACAILFVIAVLYEGLKVFRDVLQRRSEGVQRRDHYTSSLNSIKKHSHTRACVHLLQSFLHLIQVTVSYLLMLAVMTFNVWLGLSVVLGAGVGYLLFAWKRNTVKDVNEHCN